MKLDISHNKVGNEGATALGNLLSNMSTLKILNIRSMPSQNHTNDITPQGWQTLFTTLQESNLDLVKMDVSFNNIDDDGLQLLIRFASRMSSLKHLYLGNNQVALTSWYAPPGLLSPNFVLETLDLSSSNLNDDTVVALTSALANNNNNTLKRLDLDYITDEDDNELITDRGWEAISTLLCNKTSIMDTYNSNHTLQYLGEYIPDDIESYLKLNRNKDKLEVARQKILQTHFSTKDDDSKIQELLDMELEVIPTAIAWIGRSLPIGWCGKSVSGLSLLYNLMRRLPDLFDSDVHTVKESLSKRMRKFNV